MDYPHAHNYQPAVPSATKVVDTLLYSHRPAVYEGNAGGSAMGLSAVERTPYVYGYNSPSFHNNQESDSAVLHTYSYKSDDAVLAENRHAIGGATPEAYIRNPVETSPTTYVYRSSSRSGRRSGGPQTITPTEWQKHAVASGRHTSTFQESPYGAAPPSQVSDMLRKHQEHNTQPMPSPYEPQHASNNTGWVPTPHYRPQTNDFYNFDGRAGSAFNYSQQVSYSDYPQMANVQSINRQYLPDNFYSRGLSPAAGYAERNQPTIEPFYHHNIAATASNDVELFNRENRLRQNGLNVGIASKSNMKTLHARIKAFMFGRRRVAAIPHESIRRDAYNSGQNNYNPDYRAQAVNPTFQTPTPAMINNGAYRIGEDFRSKPYNTFDVDYMKPNHVAPQLDDQSPKTYVRSGPQPASLPNRIVPPMQVKASASCQLHLIGEIVGADGFNTSSGLFCEFNLILGDDWMVFPQSIANTQQTQASIADETGFVAWSHPINIHLESNNKSSVWPWCTISVFKLDNYGNTCSVSYGAANLPVDSGYHTIKCKTWSPCGTLQTLLRERFLDLKPSISNAMLLSYYSGETQFQTEPSGTVTIHLHAMNFPLKN